MQKCYMCKSSRRQLLMLSCSHDVCIKCAADNYFLSCVQKQDQGKGSTKTTNTNKKSSNYFCQICLQVTVLDESTINQLKDWYINNVNSPNQKAKENSKSKKLKTVAQYNHSDVATVTIPKSQFTYTNQQKNNNKPAQNRSTNTNMYQEQQKGETYYQQQQQNNRRNMIQQKKQRGSVLPQRNFPTRLVTEYADQYGHNRNPRAVGGKDSLQTKMKYQNNYRQKTISNDKYYERQGRQERQEKPRPSKIISMRRQNQRLSYRNYELNENQTNRYHNPNQNQNHNQNIQTSRHSGTSQKKIFGSIVKRGEVQNNIQLKNQIFKAREQQRRRINSYKSQEQLKYIHPHQLQKNVKRPEQNNREQIVTRPINNYRQQSSEIHGSQNNNYMMFQPKYQRNQTFLYSQEDEIDQFSRQNYSNTRSNKHQNFANTTSYSKNLVIQQKQRNQRQFQRNQRAFDESQQRSPTQKQTIVKKNTNQSNMQKQRTKTLKCKIHQDQEIIYYCLDCKILICSQCALYGNHKDHNIHTLKKASLKLKQTLYSLITELNGYLLVQEQKQQQLIDQIKQIKVECNKQKERVKFSFENFLKNIQNKYAQILEQLQESQTRSLSVYNEQLERCKSKCEEFVLMKNNMKCLFDTFAKGQNAPLAQYNFQNQKTLQSPNSQTTVSNNFNNFVTNRVYRQFDDVFEENSMTSSQRNFFNSNIQELQAKITDYEQYIKKTKFFYDSVIYPKLSSQKKQRRSVNSLQYLNKQSNRQHNRESQMQQSLRFSQNSMLLYNSSSPHKDSIKADDSNDSAKLFTQNNIRSINLIIQNEVEIKLAYVDVIVQSVKEIEEIVKQFKIQYKSYEMKAK